MERIKLMGGIVLFATLFFICILFLSIAKLIKIVGIFVSKIFRIIGFCFILQWDKAYYEIRCEDIMDELDSFISI